MPARYKKLVLVLPLVLSGIILLTAMPSRPQSGYADKFKM